ncbi:hypothetical protein CK203_076118 [Vitis vinifera]|uniref:Uncharacterized protein n=1 Tax=Vitis vinifera TaxID=29760 RepID=A0A438EM20_VITVI|nr:hypothetical protein CK203_076118 [Vitis vinifera]
MHHFFSECVCILQMTWIFLNQIQKVEKSFGYDLLQERRSLHWSSALLS